MRTPIVALVLTAVATLPVTASAGTPETIDLPEGFAGEGVSVVGNTFYAGSLADGRIAVGDLVAGTSEVFVADPILAPAVGVEADAANGLLWVAGGPTGRAAVYDLHTGEAVADLTLTTEAAFINDVVATGDAAYFTNSFTPEIYRVAVVDGTVGDPETIELSGPVADFVDGFNLNGIEATADGQQLIVVNSARGTLYAVDPDTGSSSGIPLGDDDVRSGDGILLQGRTLYVLQNGTSPLTTNEVAVVRLAPDLSSGEVISRFTSELFETATTLGRRGNLLVAVNAQFAGAPIDPEAEVVLLKVP